MSKLEELIKEFCPNGVEYKPLWSLTAWDKRFNGIDRSMQKKVVSYKYYLSSEFNEVERKDGDILYIPTGITNEKKYTTEELAGEHLAEGEIVCIPWGGTPNVKYHKGKFVTGDNRIATSLDTNILDNKYLYYWMQSKIDLIASFYRGAGIQHPSMKSVLELQIPLPALPVQREIVQILDSFTLYSAELTAELTARRKQYEFYRDKLLNFSSEIQFFALGDVIVSLNTGLNPRQFFHLNTPDAKNYYVTIRELQNGKIVFTDKTDKINDFALKLCNNRSNLEVGDVLFSGTGTIGTTAIIDKPPLNWNIKEGVYAIKPNKRKINSKFLMYLLQCQSVRDLYLSKAAGGTVQSVPMGEMKKLKIPVPPMDVQERIVKVLDNFDAICSDLGIGLPAEIEKRQKQYEYYREKLLTFDGKSETIFRQTDRQTDRQTGLIRLLQYVYGFAFVRLGDIGKVSMCKRIMKADTTNEGDIPFYKIGTFGKKADAFIKRDKYEEYKAKYSYPKKGDVLISAAGTIGRSVIYDGKPAYYQDSNIVWLEHDETMALNKYLFYIYQTNPWRISAGGTISRLYNDNITSTVIPLPTLEKQKEIVEILDKFDSLCNDLTAGLPAEIEHRQKQYEYYRDKLLRFK